MQKAKPAAAQGDSGDGYRRTITVRNWKPFHKNTLVGFFSATMPDGVIIHNLTLHEKNGSRWIGMPAREWTNDAGEKQFARLVEFTSREIADTFRDAVLEALDQHLGTQR